MADGVSIRVTGLDDLDRAFARVGADLAAELGSGFVPKARYRGLAGEPFTAGKVELLATRAGFEVRGFEDAER